MGVVLGHAALQDGSAWGAAAKRCLDVVAAIFGLIFAVPLMVLIAVAIFVETPGGPFFAQIRCGRDGRLFRCWKFRTMVGPECVVLAPDETARCTRIGRILRKAKLDELPQLWNVLRGEMSLVGPRPLSPKMETWLAQNIPGHERRLAVRPGITGLAQVAMERPIDLQGCTRRLQFDLAYIASRSLLLDLRIMWRTLNPGGWDGSPEDVPRLAHLQNLIPKALPDHRRQPGYREPIADA